MAKEIRLGRWTDPVTDTEWRVEKWQVGRREKNIDSNRLTRRDLEASDKTTFAIALPSGKVIYRTFTGPLPDDIQDLIDYWRKIDSL